MTKLQDAAAIAKVTLGLLFASAFQVPMVWSSWSCPVSVSDSVQIAQFCIYSLCRHQQYVDKLREEALAWEDARHPLYIVLACQLGVNQSSNSTLFFNSFWFGLRSMYSNYWSVPVAGTQKCAKAAPLHVQDSFTGMHYFPTFTCLQRRVL